MKKTSALIVLSGMCLLFAGSCKKGSSFDCASQIVKITVAAQVYASEDSDANCTNYKVALKEYLDKGCNDNRADFQNAYDNIITKCP